MSNNPPYAELQIARQQWCKEQLRFHTKETPFEFVLAYWGRESHLDIRIGCTAVREFMDKFHTMQKEHNLELYCSTSCVFHVVFDEFCFATQRVLLSARE